MTDFDEMHADEISGLLHQGAQELMKRVNRMERERDRLAWAIRAYRDDQITEQQLYGNLSQKDPHHD
jgi:hypothetical protein